MAVKKQVVTHRGPVVQTVKVPGGNNGIPVRHHMECDCELCAEFWAVRGISGLGSVDMRYGRCTRTRSGDWILNTSNFKNFNLIEV